MRFYCAEYCGTKHSGMIGEVIVMEPDDYQAWLTSGTQEGSLSSAGAKLFQDLACNTCHRSDAQGRGPVLAGLYGKRVALQTGETVQVDEAYLREAILMHAVARLALFPAIRALMRRGMKINPDSAARSLAKVEAVFARIDERLRDGRRYLCGDALSAADLTFACLSAPVVMPQNYGTAPLPELAELPRGLVALVERFRATAAGQLALRLYAEDRRR